VNMSLFICSTQELGSERKRRKLDRFGRKDLESLSTIGNGVWVKKSELPGAGNGLFALRDFEEGEPITAYEPIAIITREASEKGSNEAMAYAMHFLTMENGGVVIVGADTPFYGKPGGSFANDPLDTHKVNTMYQPIDLDVLELSREDLVAGPSDDERDETYEVPRSKNRRKKESNKDSSPSSSPGANGASRFSSDPEKWAHGEFMGSALILVATKPIKSGEEIYACYGTSYWLGEPGDREVRGDPRKYEPDLYALSMASPKTHAIRYPVYASPREARKYNPYNIVVTGANPPKSKSKSKSARLPASVFALPGDIDARMYAMIHTTIGIPQTCNVSIGNGSKAGYFAPRPDEDWSGLPNV